MDQYRCLCNASARQIVTLDLTVPLEHTERNIQRFGQELKETKIRGVIGELNVLEEGRWERMKEQELTMYRTRQRQIEANDEDGPGC